MFPKTKRQQQQQQYYVVISRSYTYPEAKKNSFYFILFQCFATPSASCNPTVLVFFFSICIICSFSFVSNKIILRSHIVLQFKQFTQPLRSQISIIIKSNKWTHSLSLASHITIGDLTLHGGSHSSSPWNTTVSVPGFSSHSLTKSSFIL